MSVEVVVPSLGESVSEATIAKWYKKAGDHVEVDELLLELETEKVTLEINATSSGILDSISCQENDAVSVGQVVGVIRPMSKEESAEKQDKKNDTQDQNQTSIKKEEAPAVNKESTVNKSDTMSPSVRKLVNENNLDIERIDGTGKQGRVNKGDVLDHLNSNKNSSSITENQSESAAKPVERVKMSRLRKTIAQRLKESQNTAAILTTFNEIDMSNVIALRSKYKDSFKEKHGVKLGFMSFFTKAVVNALKAVPSVNAEIEEDHIIYKNYYDIGVAVGTEQGLVVPVVQGADKLSFSGIEQEILSLATKAREGKLSMSDLSGGTFSITNGGVYGSLLSTPIINPPQTGIIGLHNTQQRPVVVDGKIEIRPMMYVALSYDHRIIDGKDAVTFLIKVKEVIEDPQRLLLDM
ncbi:MAG TPA: 2-oxoglutarate dehydrogenase complex dihydrolipoyllysine-residue succinyltransferase [Candidatus Megaira endosymbiont of Nemacystus decipiens]|nr:2-oxoglutarate dehydrogenase complex dihydrolipoyllysine-residue succinyltransferase [Candidatus Megaera endosymbiont of Nemacystus decipiens]